MFEKQIAKGVKFLDENVPNWLKKISVKKLNMQDGDFCVLGQLFKKKNDRWTTGYSIAARKFTQISNIRDRDELGFTINNSNHSKQFPLLTKEWADTIAQLRKAKRVA